MTIVFVESNRGGAATLGMDMLLQRGHEVAFISSKPEAFAESLATLKTDLQVSRVDTLDPAAIADAVSAWRPTALVAYSDFHSLAAARAEGLMGLDRISLAAMETVRHKGLLRKALAATRFRTDYRIVDIDELGSEPPQPYPFVVKPVDDGGSSGVYVCRDRTDFLRAVSFLRGYLGTPNIMGYRTSREVLVEPLLAGSEFSAEMMWCPADGSWKVIGITAKTVSPPPHCVELAHVHPYFFASQAVHASVLADLVDLLDTVGLRGTSAHVEFFVDDSGQFSLVEVNPRPGGGGISGLIGDVWGLSSYEIHALVAAGEAVTLPERPRRAAGMVFSVPARVGTVTGWQWPLDQLGASGVEVVWQTDVRRVEITTVGDNSAKVAGLHVAAGSFATVETVIHSLINTARFTYDEEPMELRRLDSQADIACRRMLAEVVDAVPARPDILDVGVGTGKILRHLQTELDARRAVGVDMRADRVESLVARLPVEGVAADARDLPFPDESFDLVYARLLLIHVPDPQKAIAEMYRCVRPGGTLALWELDAAGVYWHPEHPAIANFQEVKYRSRIAEGKDPYIGRKLCRYLMELGATDIRLSISTLDTVNHDRDYLGAITIDSQGDDLVRRGLLSAAEHDEYLAEIRAFFSDPASFMATTDFLVLGRRP